ncbi:MAG: NAD(P)-dependent oxidoreductase [Coxiella sp. (in: Bacteria)]|nr:MAG: NAD(P)-dependent oxidoreductase [Coxiella sp. (in: g-proteobacteria)]
MSLQGKTVLITGASFGIGEACAHAFAKAGARVIISARTESKLEALKMQLETEHGATVHSLVMDVCDRAGVKSAIQGLGSDWSKLDILLNNAGLALGFDTLQDGNLDDWDRMIDTNVKGLLYVTHFVLPGMIAANSGHVINIGSTSGYQVYAKGVAYCATKFAVRAITEGLKMDVHETRIRVTEIDPGMVDTEFSTVRFKGDSERADSVYDGFKPLAAADIADAVLYAVTAPAHVNVRQMLVTPTAQTANGMVYKED